MVPVACLGVEPHHRVLDMCASPGSKTGQVVEALHGGPELPSGLVIACEPDRGRCSTLAGNMNLLPSPAALVVCDEGQTFPDILDAGGEAIRYDRIVCDVPCSGDGTVRKNPNIWEKWSPGSGNARHGLQLAIARRGARLLAEGGVMAYSSCSINCVENEAVVAALLQEGGLELVAPPSLPGLSWLPGLSTWLPHDGSMRPYSAPGEVPDHLRTQLPPSAFPPAPAVAAGLHLHRCMRFLPHLNDDGGFFVALLRRVNKNSQMRFLRRTILGGSSRGPGGPRQGEEGDRPEGGPRGAAARLQGAEAAAAAPLHRGPRLGYGGPGGGRRLRCSRPPARPGQHVRHAGDEGRWREQGGLHGAPGHSRPEGGAAALQQTLALRRRAGHGGAAEVASSG
jgi:16S rRNA C967 or C1407 C5-methylase (RsmB/RsmF family)